MGTRVDMYPPDTKSFSVQVRLHPGLEARLRSRPALRRLQGGERGLAPRHAGISRQVKQLMFNLESLYIHFFVGFVESYFSE